MATQDLAKRILTIKQRIASASSEKAKLEGELESQKKSLAALVKEIKDLGYDPKRLKSIRAEKQQEIEKMCNDLETQLTKVEGQIKDIRGDS